MSDNQFGEIIQNGYLSKGLSCPIGVAVFEKEPVEGLVVYMPLKMLNRHGLIAGATGTGKTKTLQVIAEQLSRNGIPSILMDLKGDLGGLAVAGKKNEIVETRRKLFGGKYDYVYQGFPVNILSIGEDEGVSVKASIQEFGPVLLSKILGLNNVQSGIISIAFKYCEDKKLVLNTIADLKYLLTKICDDNTDIKENYGNISGVSITTILRNIAELEQQGGNYLIGAPAIDVSDLILNDENDNGVLSIIRLTQLQEKPALFSTFIIYLLSKLYATLPEVGDLEKPKLVMFIDEAHLLFNDSNKIIQDKIESIIKLIRSKGVGIIFCTQTPADISVNVLGQLGLKIQHSLRAFTAKDRKSVKMMAQNFPETSFYNVEEDLTSLGIGEAFVTLLRENGTPSPLVKTLIAPPMSRMGILDDKELTIIINRSSLKLKYGIKNNIVIKPSKELEGFYQKLKLIKENEKIAELQEKERAKQKTKQENVSTKVTIPRRQSYTNMMFGTILPMTNMFSNVFSGANNGMNNPSSPTQYYYTKDGQQYGPVSEFQISNSILNGEINAFTYLWKNGMPEWALATQFQEFQNILK
jgi:DNA helicase HerA-like ATPase